MVTNGSWLMPSRRRVSRSGDETQGRGSSTDPARRSVGPSFTVVWILFTLAVAAAIFAWAAFAGTICGSGEDLRWASLWVLVAGGIASAGPVGVWLMKRTRAWKIVSVVAAVLCLLLFLSYFVPSFSAPTEAEIGREANCRLG